MDEVSGVGGGPSGDEASRGKSFGKDTGGGGVGGATTDEVTRTKSFGRNAGEAAGVPLGPKPGNFFELLAAAISATKLKTPTESHKGPDFILYLKQSGIKMAWVRAIVALYEEPKKPDDPLAYIVKLMGLGIPEQIDVKRMQDQVTRLRGKLINLQAENIQLREIIEREEEALQIKDDLVSLYDETNYFSPYNSDDDDYTEAEETQQL